MVKRLALVAETALTRDPAFDVALGPVLLREGLGGADGIVRIFVPAPTAAFSRRDTLRPGFAAAAEACRKLGFTPVIRPQGGRLAAYHQGSVVVDHVVRTAHPHAGLVDRFRTSAERHRVVLARFAADVRVGEVPGEYCPGEFSLNVGGVRKIAGSAQRVTKDGWLFSTIIQVTGAERLRDVLVPAYDALGYDLDPATVGALDSVTPQEIAAGLRLDHLGSEAQTVELEPALVRLTADLADSCRA